MSTSRDTGSGNIKTFDSKNMGITVGILLLYAICLGSPPPSSCPGKRRQKLLPGQRLLDSCRVGSWSSWVGWNNDPRPTLLCSVIAVVIGTTFAQYNGCVQVVEDNGDSEAVGRHNGMPDLYRSVHRPSSTAVCTHVLSQVY